MVILLITLIDLTRETEEGAVILLMKTDSFS